MGLIQLEHSKVAYWADFVVYGVAVFALAALLVAEVPRGDAWGTAAIAAAGLLAWTAIEYALHRFVLHGLPPFNRWHALHHERPAALICTPTLLSAALVASFVFMPALLLGTLWQACALTFGLLIGYLAYALTHHATHHWRTRNGWLLRRKHWHARHHHGGGPPGCYGVTTGFWDVLLGTCRKRASLLTKPDISPAHAPGGSPVR